MGSNESSLRKKKYLTQEEIDSIISKNVNLLPIFKKMKNSDGLLTTNELNIITYGLINPKIRKRIIQICGSKADKLNLEDLCYFYSLINTNSVEAKLNFLLDFIFIKKDKLSKEKYVHKVIKYFVKSQPLQSMFLDPKLLEKEKQEKNIVYKFIISNKLNEIKKYPLYKSENNSIQENDINDDNNSKNILLLRSKTNSTKYNNSYPVEYHLEGKKRQILNPSHTINLMPIKCKYDYLKNEFEEYEKNNNGVFPIALFEEMLNEINVNPSIIRIIGSYLTLKAKKSFFNFDLFKEILTLLTQEESNNYNLNDKYKDSLTDGLFTLFSYPNDYITKNALITIIKETRPELSQNQIHSIFEKMQIKKHISKEKFGEIVDIVIKELVESLEHITYFKYIFFNTKLEDHSLEKNCIELLLKGHSLHDYIIERLQYDKEFFIIDKDFYNKWEDFMSLSEEEQRRVDIKGLRMTTNKISDRNGRLLDNKEYDVDYIILSKRIYELFYKWYGPIIGAEVKREKIFLDDFDKSNNMSSSLSISKQGKIKRRKNNNINSVNNIFKGIDLQTQQRYELEIFPIFLLFYNFIDLLRKNITMNDIKEDLKKNLSNKSNNSFYSFTRKTKFESLLKLLEDSVNAHLDRNTTRLWLYYNDKFEVVNYEETLEEKGIVSDAIIVLEIRVDNYWPSYKLRKESKLKDKKSINHSGLINIGNTCYMNSVLQIFLNIKKLKDIFIKTDPKENESFLNFITDEEKPKKCMLIKEFINLLKEKWVEEKKEIAPKKFKEICGEYNDTFKGFDQQDAHDFYTFLVDNLHEDTNIKTTLTRIEENESTKENLTENDLANEYWANTVRNNASYFYGLFMGQLKSTLICSECKKSKLKFEPFSSVELPIPEAKRIILEITLFRLPFHLKPLFKPNISPTKKNSFTDTNMKKQFQSKTISEKPSNDKDNNISINVKKKIRKHKMSEENLNTPEKIKNKNEVPDNSTNIGNSVSVTNLIKSQDSERIKSPMNEKDKIISNTLNFNIPLRLKIEINRSEKCSKIIEYLKGFSELNLEKNENYTEFVMLSKDNYIEQDMKIDDTFLNNQKISIYELLNSEGIKYIFNYNDISTSSIVSLKKQKIEILNNNQQISQSNLKTIKYKKITTQKRIQDNTNKKKTKNNNSLKITDLNFIIPKEITNYDSYEILIPIIHRYIKDINSNKGLFPIENFIYIYDYSDFIILSTKNSIKPYNLYEMMWEKYMYFLNSPSKFENICWWKKNIKENPKNNTIKLRCKNCAPFKIKIIDKNTHACAFCPWFRFCTGCTLDPNNDNYLNILSDYIIVVEWCGEVFSNEINKNNITLKLNHSSYNEIVETTNGNMEKVTIDDCFKLFTKKEEIKDILCENCKKKTTFTKSLEIERIPKYLVIVLKRFKYTLMYMNKIDCLINFPTEHLNLKDYITQKKIAPKYDLFGVIYHGGNLTRGHYNCIIKQKNVWMKFDDSYVGENDGNIENPNAYILIYKTFNKEKINKKEFNFNYIGLMNTAYKIYLKQKKFEHLFNYILDNKEQIINVFPDNCQFYFGEPVTVDGNAGYLIYMFKKEEEKEINVKIKIKNGFFISKVLPEKIIKETVKFLEIQNDSNNKVGGSVEKRDSVCGHCEIF